MPTIREVLARRSDLSTFIVHLTRANAQSARQNLESILRDYRIRAATSLGSATKSLQERELIDCLDCQKVVCFTETPLEHISLLLVPITDLVRTCVFKPYGIAFTKRVAREKAINPVWYVDITPGHDWLMVPINALIDQAADDVVTRRASGDAAAHFKTYPVAKVAPFIEQMGVGPGYRKEFWWEREWRHRGDFLLPPWFVVIAPEPEHEHFSALMKQEWGRGMPLVDAKWGLEEIIGRLAGFSPEQIHLL